ncbi:MAG: hypothetical protein C0504_10550 [Candidatus Solibacter sp.]|nr:hypothetical protein [Candidatus Solibacter sp.]
MWLNLTNVGLGVVALVCVVAVAYNIVSELLIRKHAARTNDSHAMHVPELGWTMADGGEPVGENRPGRKKAR